jgi:large conductance mechanosensitive channel
MWSDFRAFLVKDNVIGLAIAVILGGTLNKLVGSIVDDLLMPVIGLLTPSGDWQQWSLALTDSARLKVGSFLAALLNFLVIGFVCWRISLAFTRKPQSSA